MPDVADAGRAFGVYVHVPFCSVRCGYCDFNTYAPGETGGATPEGYVDAALREMALGAATMGERARPAQTVFFGGGTPTMLDVPQLTRLLEGVREHWGLAADAEVTTEANPDSVDERALADLAEAGFSRVSLGMQSAVPHVLRTLDRTHDPVNVERAVAGAKAAGLRVSVDLIYGTPGESRDDWRRSVETALSYEPDHVSAYALVIEPGTRMGSQLRRGQIDAVDEDAQAAMYEDADDAFTAAGLRWYEVSNWAVDDDHRCRHNLGYWRGDDWWGIGPGAHSYLSAHGEEPARRWWNVKHPRAYGDRLAAGESPEMDGETLTEEDTALESIMLGVRVAEGLSASALAPGKEIAAGALAERGLLDASAWSEGLLVLTRRGRLLADAVVRDLT